MMAKNDDRVFNGSVGNRIENIFEKGSATNGEKGLRPSHPLRFTSSKDDCRYQCVSPDLLRLDRWTEIQIPECVKERNQKHQQENQGDNAKKRLSPNGIL